jgi:hypothetical protein
VIPSTSARQARPGTVRAAGRSSRTAGTSRPSTWIPVTASHTTNDALCAISRSNERPGPDHTGPDEGVGDCTSIRKPRALDGIESTATFEYADTLSDLMVGTGWSAADGSEIGDECANLDRHITLTSTASLPGSHPVRATYDVAGLWSNNQNRCATKGN